MRQGAGETLINLQRIARELKVDDVINPPRVLDAARKAAIALDGNANVNPEVIASLIPLQALTWFIPSWVVVTSNAREELPLPQAATAVRLVAYCKIAPVSGPMTADLYSNGTYVDSVSISVGETASVSTPVDPAKANLPALARLHLAITSHGNAADASISLLFRPHLGATP